MKIATFNVNGIGGRWENVAQWLAREQPDVACLQELKAPQERFPAMALKDMGYYALWQGERAWNGVAIASRIGEPIESRRGLPGDATDTQSRYIEAAVNGVVIGCLYAPNGNPQPGPKFEYKLAWLRRLQRHAAALVTLPHPVVLAGDFNVVPTDFDIYNPKSWLKDALLQPESRREFDALLAQGWTDSIRQRHPNERIYTFWDYFRNHWARDAGLRIDHLLANPTAASLITCVGVDRWVRGEAHASDHAPAWILLEDRARRRAPKSARKAVKHGAPTKKKKGATAKAPTGRRMKKNPSAPSPSRRRTSK
jgi:exodeoxyribonuclease III